MLLAGVLCLVVLVAALAVVRRRGRPVSLRSSERVEPSAWTTRPSRREVAAGALAVCLSSFPLLWLLPPSWHATFWGDDLTHARIAADVARHGLPHGWVDSYMGGFPYAHHYPPATWSLLAALIRAGLSPAAASNLLGGTAIFATPLAVYLAAVRAGARVPPAVVAAVFVAWTSPYNPFVGGYEVFFQLGLLSQALGVPIAIAMVASIVRSRSGWPPALLGAAAIAAHPQITVATLAAVGIAILVAPRRAQIIRGLRAGTSAVAVGLALYGQGIETLRVPFGWPPGRQWLKLGFPPDRLRWWLADGDLLDAGRPPFLTALAIASTLALLLLVRRQAPRAALAAACVALVGSVSGETLASAGRLGAFLLGFLQPLRMIALTPIAGAALVLVALEEGSAALASLDLSARLARAAPRALAGGALALCLPALPSRVSWAASRRDELPTMATRSCGPSTPAGYESARVKAWLAALTSERLWYSADDPALLRCAGYDSMELSVPGPIAITGGAGAHVGVHWVAFRQLAPERGGSAARAEALGIRYLLRIADGVTPAGWSTLHGAEALELLRRDGGTSLVGAGCVRETWRGSDDALRDRLQRDLVTPAGAGALLSPTSLVALETSAGPLTAAPSQEDGCSAERAVVRETPREPGALEASVRSPAPFDATLRVAAFPTWHVEIDGVPSPPRTIAPGFLSVRVPPGEHRITATAGTMPGYRWLLLLAAVAVVAAATIDRGRLRRSLKALRARRTR